jgi:hypothetical protein
MILRHLEYLSALARERHFAPEAAACGVAPADIPTIDRYPDGQTGAGQLPPITAAR